MSYEAQLYNDLQNCIRVCATLTQIPYDHPKINQIKSNPGFPVSPETRDEDRNLDHYVYVTDSFRECLYHLMEARKKLLALGVQHEIYGPSKESPHETDSQTRQQDL
jgi:hypothetical protein